MKPIFAIEGIDGAGKKTICQNLKQILEEKQISCAIFSFPFYESESGKIIAQYLNQKQNDNLANTYYLAAAFAMNRAEQKQKMLQAQKKHDIIILDRYVASNLAYQGAAMVDHHQEKMIQWIWDLEFNQFGLPQPDASFFINTPLEQAQKWIMKKGKRSYTQLKLDRNEQNTTLLQRAHDIFINMTLTQKPFSPFLCINTFDDNEHIRTSENMAQEIAGHVTKTLSQFP